MGTDLCEQDKARWRTWKEIRKKNLTVDEYNIALLDTLLSQGASKDLDLVEELCITESLFRLGHRTVIIYGGMVTMTGNDVTVNAIVARRDLPIWKPRPGCMSDAALLEGRLRLDQCRGRLLVPIEMVSLPGPKRCWVLQGLTMHIVLRV